MKQRGILFAFLAGVLGLMLSLGNLTRADDKDAARNKDKDAAPSKDKDADKDREALTDEQFVKTVSAMDLAEINLGNLAARRASGPEVKRFAQQMVTDHTRTSQALLAIANQKSILAARTMDRKHQDLADELGKMQGADFDKSYMKHMVEDHKQAVDLFRRQAKDGKDKDLKAFADKTLPDLQHHLKMAQDLAGDKTKDRKETRDRRDDR